VLIVLVALYFFPTLIVKEDVRIVYRHYAPSNHTVRGLDAASNLRCALYNKSSITSVEEWRWWVVPPILSNYTLWVLVHPVNETDVCGRLHWHVAGMVDDEDDAKYWVTQQYSEGCASGAFVAHVMNPITYLYEKLVLGYERGPISGTIFDVWRT